MLCVCVLKKREK